MKKHLYRRANGTYYYRIIHGDIQEERSARTKDKEVATKKLNDRFREIEREAEGLAIPAKIKQANQLPLGKHLDHYLAQKDREWSSHDYYERTSQRLRKLLKECGWNRTGDINRLDFLNWRSSQRNTVKTLNDYLSMLKGFVKWMNQCGLMDIDDIESIPNLRKNGEVSFERRSLTPEEFSRLMGVESAMRRAVYVTAVLTGLRRNELSLLEWGDVHFEMEPPVIVARASTTKNKKKAYLPMSGLVRDALLEIRPANASGKDRVFQMPPMKVYKSDLEKAGIAYEDEQGGRLDFHALRKSMCTMLLAHGTPVRVVQELMRHSDIKLTTGNYTDATQLPMKKAMDDLSNRLAESVTYFSTPKPTFEGVSGDGVSQTVEGTISTRTPVNRGLSRCLTRCVPVREMVEMGGIEPPSD